MTFLPHASWRDCGLFFLALSVMIGVLVALLRVWHARNYRRIEPRVRINPMFTVGRDVK